MRRLRQIAIILVGMFIGGAIGQYFNVLGAGIIAGAFVVLPLTRLNPPPKRRWVAAAFLNLWIVASYFAGGWLAAAATTASAIIAVAVSAFVLRDLYGGRRIHSAPRALTTHIRLQSPLPVH